MTNSESATFCNFFLILLLFSVIKIFTYALSMLFFLFIELTYCSTFCLAVTAFWRETLAQMLMPTTAQCSPSTLGPVSEMDPISLLNKATGLTFTLTLCDLYHPRDFKIDSDRMAALFFSYTKPLQKLLLTLTFYFS